MAQNNDGLMYPLLVLFVLNIVAILLITNTTLGFNTPTTISIGTAGVTYSSPSLCNNIFASIPVLGGFVAYLEHSYAVLVNPTSNYCSAQSGAFIIYTYDPTTAGGDQFAITNLFVDLIPLALVAVVLTGFNIVGSGYNSGAVMTLVVGGALMVAWAILSGPVLAILFQQDYGVLTTIFILFYSVLTLVFAVNSLRSMAGAATTSGGSDL